MKLDTGKSASVSDAVASRITARDFLPKPVDADLLLEIFEKARRTPSGGNLQPWNVHVFTGDKLDNFRNEVVGKLMKGQSEQDTFPPYPAPLWEPQRSWRYKLGEDMYNLLDIPKDDKPARMRQVGKNFLFFGAPVGIIIVGDKRLEVPQYYDIGIYLQTIMLLAREAGLHTAPQGAWRAFPDTVKKHTNHPDEHHVLVGMSLGYVNADAPVNDLYADRAELGELVKFHK